MLTLVCLSLGGASEDAVATTPAPNPHNQTTPAQTEVTGRVFLFSFCVVFCKFGFCIKCVSVSLGFSLAPSLMWNPKMAQVKMLWFPPQHQIPQTKLHLLELLVRGIATFLIFRPFKWLPAQLLKSRLNLPKLELLVENEFTRILMQSKGLGTLSVVVWHGHSLMFKNVAWQVSNKSIPVVTNYCLVEVEQLCLEQWHTVGFHPINVQLKMFLFLLPVVS